LSLRQVLIFIPENKPSSGRVVLNNAHVPTEQTAVIMQSHQVSVVFLRRTPVISQIGASLRSRGSGRLPNMARREMAGRQVAIIHHPDVRSQHPDRQRIARRFRISLDSVPRTVQASQAHLAAVCFRSFKDF
jgi:hypothetical protein